MTITLINKDTYLNLVKIQEDFPSITFQNDGYEYLKKSSLSEEAKAAIVQIDLILKDCIKGYIEFCNFKIGSGGVKIRFDYNWNADSEIPQASFIGVGYLYLEELFLGFKEFRKEA